MKNRATPILKILFSLLVAFFVRCGGAATFEVGPGLTYTNLGSVPWTELLPGDAVNIHFQPGGYHEIILLSRSGTPDAPISVNGVPDPVTGALPVLDGSHAVTATNTPWRANSLNTAGVIVVSPNASQPYPYYPQWIVIQNLHVQNARPNNLLTTSQGTSTTYGSPSAAIYVEFAQHLTVRGCELNSSGNGFFCDAENGDLNTTSADILIQKCWIHNNGYSGSYDSHNVNTQARGIVMEYNLIGPVDPASAGNDIKDESSGAVLRYNTVIQGYGEMAFELVQPSGGVGVIDQDPAYHSSYVYGNVFLNGANSSALTMFAYDYLGVGSHPRNGTLYFYNNTVVNYADQSARYYTEIFILPRHSDVQALGVHDVVDCRNNIFAAIPATAGGAPTQVYLLQSDDSDIVLGTNWVTPGFIPLELPYGYTNYYGTITGTNQLIVGDRHGLNNPGFVSAASTNFNLLSSSPAIDAAGPQSPIVLNSPYNVLDEYLYPTDGRVRVNNGLAMDLGAFEGVSTNINGPLFSLSVSGGYGGGSYPANAVVLIAASNAPPGQVFGGWAGYPVADPGSIGTMLVMPSTNIAVIATYSNIPDYQLTVDGGTGSGAYLPGTTVSISADAAPAGQVFAGWTGFAVASADAPSTTLLMPSSNVTITASYSNAPVSSLFYVNVVNGAGSGTYAVGSTVFITASAPATNQSFAGWTGYSVANPAALATSFIMPSNNVTVTASYQFAGPLPSKFPLPVAGHPRLWLTTNDLPKYRAWAVPSNPVYQALQVGIQRAVTDYQTQYFPGGVANPNYPDFGDIQGYTGLMTEADAAVLAFASLIDPDPVKRSEYAQYTRNLLIHAFSQAELGTLANAPFRDPAFAIFNRAVFCDDWALAVDWIYDAKDTNGQPILSPADKLTIRNGFLTWASQCLTAETTGGDSPTPVGVLNSQQLLSDNGAYRMSANNYYLSHARYLTMMSMAIDPVDDPPVNTNLAASVLGNSLRSYLDDAVGAWMYQEYSLFGDPASVISDYGLDPNSKAGLASGGSPPEGMLYGESVGYILMGLLAMQTSGYNDANLVGPQARLINSPVWARYTDAMLSLIVPSAEVPADASYLGPIFLTCNYGDMLRSWVTPQGMIPFALQALLEQRNGSTNHYDAARWFVTTATEGGTNYLAQRVSDWNYGVDEGLLYFMLLDPSLPPAPDPRPQLPLAFIDRTFGHIVDRTAWADNASQFDFLANWISINHQQGAAGQFQFYRNHEWLTKQLDNYDDSLNGQSSMWHNMLSLENWCTAGDPQLNWGEQLYSNGSEFMIGESAGDPVTMLSAGPGYTYASADLSPLFNFPNYWHPEFALLDVSQATRNIIWIKPDYIVVYDRAATAHTDLFKQFNLNLVAPPVIAGQTITETTPGGQQLFVHTLLPANASITYVPLNSITLVSQEEPTSGRVIVTDTNNPASTRFLHVLQGADSHAVSEAVTYLASASGDAFEGAAIHGAVVLFPVNPLSNNLDSVTYYVAGNMTNHYVGGLLPAGNYSVNVTTNAGLLSITITPGGSAVADGAGLLSFNTQGQSVPTSPKIVSLTRIPSGAQLNGSGTSGVSYSVQASTNLAAGSWITLGSTAPNSTGAFQYLDTSASSATQRYYRLAWP